MNNTILKLICIGLSVATACLSAVLTTKFMLSIGNEMGSPLLMGALGLVLDLAKCATPLFVLFLFSQRKFVSMSFALLISVALSVVSFSASVASLEQGVSASQQNSVAYQRIAVQITAYETQITELRHLADVQQSVKQVTKSQHTLERVEVLLQKVDALYGEQAHFSGEPTLVNRFGLTIAYILSAALELMTWLLVSVSHTLASVKRTQTQSTALERTQCVTTVQAPTVAPVHAQPLSQLNAVAAHSDAVNDACLATACDECDKNNVCHEQTYLDIKDAVLAKNVKPSQRGVMQHFKGVGRDTINQVLADLNDKGILRPYRNGYAFA
ncbi:hypothetical protein [Photobacterium indicum]|uniref:hypothetical protein n=1 Tax=Photobacterium indicum TaxID=81447 RepID=UPI003D0F7A9B